MVQNYSASIILPAINETYSLQKQLILFWGTTGIILKK